MDAHSRDRNMLPSATALGARMSQATFYFVPELYILVAYFRAVKYHSIVEYRRFV